MLTNDFDTFEASCDFCSTGSEEFEADNWNAAMTAMKAAGWKNSNKTGEWQHKCPDCVEG
jgi:hypothetical protein